MIHSSLPYGRKPPVTDFGGEGRIIILLHGFLSSSRYWKKLQPHLTRAGYRVITIDLLGFGNAPRPRHSDYSYDAHVSYLHASIKDLHLSSPYILIGHSMGALLAARYGRLHPGSVWTLILLHPPLYKDSAEAYATLRATNRLYRFLLDSHYRRLGWALIKTFAGYYIRNHGRAARERSLKNVIEKAEAFDDLKTISVRTMLIVGLKDRVEYANNLVLHDISEAITVFEEEVTHHSPIRSTDLVQERILYFLSH